MPRSVPAIVKPEMLSWARRSSGYELEAVAKKVSVTPERLALWETGESRPTIKQLRKLADVYKRPMAVFYLPEPPRGFQAMKDFRTPQGRWLGAMSPELTLSIRKAQERRQIAHELARLIDYESIALTMSASLSDDPEQLGEKIRNYVGISLENQYTWSYGRESFNNWRTVFENAGILVFQIYDVKASEVSGYSLNSGSMPVIAVNVKDSYNRRIFTMFHELAHILIHTTGICDLSEPQVPSAKVEMVEPFCNRVAGACLVPLQAIHGDQTVLNHAKHEMWSDREIDTLSRRFGVSREAFVRRLVFAGLADDYFYRLKREQYLSEHEEASSPSVSRRGPLPHIKTLSSLGHAFVSLVLQNFYRDNITASTVSDHLDMKLGHLSKLEASISSIRR